MLVAPAFSSPRLTFRAMVADKDAPFFVDMWGDAQTQFQAMGSACQPLKGSKIEEIVKHLEKSTLSVMICLPATSTDGPEAKETVIGWMQLHERQAGSPHRKADLGLSLHRDHQGKGYGKEAIRWLLEMAFLSHSFHRIECEAFVWNEAAVKVYTSLGFKEEGRKRESMWQAGAWRDEVILAILEQDWREANPDKLQPGASGL
ncbi:hypothetical protein JCM10207_004122 [Rhodosporidiobolus poonsookiae]